MHGRALLRRRWCGVACGRSRVLSLSLSSPFSRRRNGGPFRDSFCCCFVLHSDGLSQVERHALHILSDASLCSRLSAREHAYASEYVDMLEQHFSGAVLDQLPESFRDLTAGPTGRDAAAVPAPALAMAPTEDMVERPKLDEFVFCQILSNLGASRAAPRRPRPRGRRARALSCRAERRSVAHGACCCGRPLATRQLVAVVQRSRDKGWPERPDRGIAFGEGGAVGGWWKVYDATGSLIIVPRVTCRSSWRSRGAVVSSPGEVEVDEKGERDNLAAGDVRVLRYRPMRAMVANGDVALL